MTKAHGHLERRRLTATTALNAYLDWPGVQQVFRIQRQIIRLRTGEVLREEVVYGLTSLPPTRATAADLLASKRAHWHIENRSHWVRDVTFEEDRCQVREGSVPEVLAALRNTTISLLRLAGWTNLAAACRRQAAHPWEALALLGITPQL